MRWNAPFTTKYLRRCVFPGVPDTFASALRPASALTSDDLPTFERPDRAISGLASGGHSLTLPALSTNSSESIFTRTLRRAAYRNAVQAGRCAARGDSLTAGCGSGFPARGARWD